MVDVIIIEMRYLTIAINYKIISSLLILICLLFLPSNAGVMENSELLKKADLGDATSQFLLGCKLLAGEGVTKNEEEALKWFLKASDQGDADSLVAIAMFHKNGWGGLRKDQGEALKWFIKAADKGSERAQYEVGYCYEKGENVKKNDTDAAKWYLKAALQGNSNAQFRLAYFYKNSKGVVKNDIESAKWYLKSAEQGNALAQTEIGVCYDRGEGVAKDEVQAYKWTLLAAAQGIERAKKNLEVAEGKLTPEHRSEGQRLAADWQRNFEKSK